MEKPPRGKLLFEIPEDREVMAKLVEAVPSCWSWVDGGLYAPRNLIISGKVEEKTGFALGRFYDIRPTVVGSYDRFKNFRCTPHLFAVMVEQKLPGFINFDEAGYEGGVVTLEIAKRIAVGFLRKYYHGRLSFFRDCYDNSKYENPARCEMIFKSIVDVSPSRMKLEWDSRYGGKEEDIAPIIAVCHSFKLNKYISHINCPGSF